MKYNVLFLLHSRGTEGSSQRLQMRVKWNGGRSSASISLGYAVDPAGWDAKAQVCLPKTYHGAQRIPARVINNEIRRYSDSVRDVFCQFSEKSHCPTSDELRAALRDDLGLDADGSKEPELWATYQEFIVEREKLASWTHRTVQKFCQVRTHLKDSGLFSHLEDFTTENLERWVAYLRDEVKHAESTVFRYLGYLRWYLKWAEGKGYLKCRDYLYFRPKMRPASKPVIFLTWDELMSLWNFTAPEHPYYETVRDVFCFCAFTSLRYSDAVALRWQRVEDDCIHVLTQKTTDYLTIELNDWSTEILNRWVDAGLPEDRVFPKIPNAVMNRYLKEICKSLDFVTPITVTRFEGGERIDETFPKWQLIGTHAARRTFIVNALSKGIAPSVVMQWTGHSDYDAMKPYIAITDAARKSAMKLFNL